MLLNGTARVKRTDADGEPGGHVRPTLCALGQRTSNERLASPSQ